MVRNYLKTTLRFLLKHKSYSIINILGLAIGIASFIVIALHVQYELSYNKHIKNSHNKYRVVEIQTEPGVGEQHVAVTMGPLAEALKKDFPEVIDATRVMLWGNNTVNVEDRVFTESYFAFADTNVFDMLSIPIIIGDKNNALKEPMAIVLSKKIALKYFNNIEESIGQTIEIEGTPFKVTAIMDDMPNTSSFYTEALIPIDLIIQRFEWLRGWGSNSLDTYIELKEGTSQKDFEAKFPEFLKRNITDNEWTSNLVLYLQSFENIHLNSKHIKFQVTNHNQGDINEVFVFSVIAFLILLVACINYINLSTARAVNRAKEVGVRKVLGAIKSKLKWQFICESLVFSILASIIALVMVELILPYVNNILNSELDIQFSNWILSIGIIGIIILVTVFSGGYPAFYLSRFQPIKVLKGGLQKSGKGSGFLRKALVIVQFSIAIIIITSTLIAISQLNYFKTKDKGYSSDQIYSVYLNRGDTANTKRIEIFKNELAQNPDVLSLAAAAGSTGVAGSQGRMTVNDSAKTQLMVRWGYFDENFLNTMQIKLLKGRTFSKENLTDGEQSIILNKIAVEELGWDNPIGKQIIHRRGDSVPCYKVIGVINDYNYYSMHSPIEPAAYLYDQDNFEVLNLKLKEGNLEQTVNEIEAKFIELFPNLAFRGQFLNDQFEYEYKGQINATKTFTLFAILCIFISCLGLFGLISFVVTQRTKEVAVRKVFGSNVSQIITMINKDFAKLIIVAGVIASPIAFIYMNDWLNNFAYRISISWYYFAFAIVASLIISVLTITYHSIKTARINPSRSLKYE